jgi:hypothetical protein
MALVAAREQRRRGVSHAFLQKDENRKVLSCAALHIGMSYKQQGVPGAMTVSRASHKRHCSRNLEMAEEPGNFCAVCTAIL